MKENNYVLSCCSASDMSKEYFEQRNIPVLCFHFKLGETEYLDDMGKTVSPSELYRRTKQVYGTLIPQAPNCS